MYAKLSKILEKFISKSSIYKYGFNLSPMYRRSTGRIFEVSDDLLEVKVRIKLSYKNSNYVGSIFGGSLFSATDPIFMIQLINILDNNYVVWDKAATIKFKRPAKETCYVDFIFTADEITQIKKDVSSKKEIDLIKDIQLTNKDKSIVFAEVSKTVYIADKKYYKEKRNLKKEKLKSV
jgi:acyl-coenzyme A thioesterase PaaI-like protein